MFTGIVTDVGEIETADAASGPDRLVARIRTAYDTGTIAIGASIAADGVCLTVEETGPNWYRVTASAETLARTTVGDWRPGRRVNLERSLRVGDEIGGHIVSGHVDGVAETLAVETSGDMATVTLRVPGELARFVAPKGSIALDGVSLTVNEVDGAVFGVALIPHTRKATTLGDLAKGGRANVEIDMLARYVARLSEHRD